MELFKKFYFSQVELWIIDVNFTENALLADRFNGYDPHPARVFGWRVLELKERGFGEEEAMAVADVCHPLNLCSGFFSTTITSFWLAIL